MPSQYEKEIENLKTEKEELEKELLRVKEDANNCHFNNDMLLHDLENERANSVRLLVEHRELAAHKKVLETDLYDADKVSTKRMNRLVEKIAVLENDIEALRKHLRIILLDLKSITHLCDICKNGVKTVTCFNCSETICRTCFSRGSKRMPSAIEAYCPACGYNGSSGSDSG